MKQIEKIAEAKNFNAISLGNFNELNDFVVELGPDVKIPGKVFGGTALKTRGAEFSFQSFAPGTETGFLHIHKTHEELYFFLSGQGEFQVDGQVIPVNEGTVICVAPEGNVRYVIMVLRLSSCFACSIKSVLLFKKMPRTALS